MPQDIHQSRVQDDLRGLIEGEVRCDVLISQLYATDASAFEVTPLGVVWPRNTGDIIAVTHYAAENEIPIHPRGSGTGAAGGSIGRGLIIDLSRFMQRIINAGDDYVTTYSGAVRERVNMQLRQSRQHYFAPSMGHVPTGTIGSILATDCMGPRWLRDRYPHDHVRELEIITAAGTIHQLRREPIRIEEGKIIPLTDNSDRPSLLADKDGVWAKLAQLLLKESATVYAQQQSPAAPCPGYRLEGVLTANHFDPVRLLVGSEGTLGIITKATLATSSSAPARGSVIFLFESIDKAVRSIEIIRQFRPTLCDMIDRRIINMVCEWDKRFRPLLPSDAEVAVVVELDTETNEELQDKLHRLSYELCREANLSFGSRIALTAEERVLFRDLLRKSKVALLRIRYSYQIVSLLEDVAVPDEFLPQFVLATQNILKRHGITYSLSGHLGQGQLRFQPILGPSQSDIGSFLLPVVDEIYDELFRCNGIVGATYGVGYARTFALAKRYGELTAVFRRVKELLDPDSLLNPGCIVPLENSTAHRSFPFRNRPTFSTEPPEVASTPAKGLKNQLELQIRWEPQQLTETTFQCTGCGLCRIRTAETRMCPIFRHQPVEENSCRAKANFLRGLLDRKIPLDAITGEEAMALAEACSFCHCCKPECPAQVDIPKLVFRIKSAHVASHGLGLRERLFSNIDTLLTAGSLLRPRFRMRPIRKKIKNLMARIGNFFRQKNRLQPVKKRFNTLGHRLLGIAPTKKRSFASPVPLRLKFIKKHYSRLSRHRGTKVALFIDSYANFFDSQLVEATIAVLEHNGVDIHIPPRLKGAGHEAFVFGNGDRATSIVRHNTAILAELVRQRYRIVTLEPITAVCVKKEYSYIRSDEEMEFIASNTTDISSWLWELHQAGKLRLDFGPVPWVAGYHAPCRTLALTGDSLANSTPAEELLRLIPGLVVERLERGCCGLSGIVGMTKKNYRRSMKLGMPLTLALRDGRYQTAITECSACKIQIEDRTEKTTIHPIKILAYAYGLVNLSFPDG